MTVSASLKSLKASAYWTSPFASITCLYQHDTVPWHVAQPRKHRHGVVAVVVLARSEPGRQSMAILSGSAINQDGRSSGLTAPNGPSQAALLREALALAGPASEPSFVAVHGTGTPLGDPIEVGALSQALKGAATDTALASAKACFGHTEGAAGLTGASSVPKSCINHPGAFTRTSCLVTCILMCV